MTVTRRTFLDGSERQLSVVSLAESVDGSGVKRGFSTLLSHDLPVCWFVKAMLLEL